MKIKSNIYQKSRGGTQFFLTVLMLICCLLPGSAVAQSVADSHLTLEGVTLKSSTDKDIPWVASDMEGYTLMSGNKEVDNSSSAFSLEVEAESTYQITFGYKVESEKNTDTFTVRVDGNTVFKESGEMEGKFSLALSAGSHKVEFYYGKDSNISKYEDRVYLTDIKLSTDVVEMEENTPYAVCNTETNRMTFYYDKVARPFGDNQMVFFITNSNSYDRTWEDADCAEKVVIAEFDESFAAFKPLNLSKWFDGFRSLKKIIGMQYLDTSEVQVMVEMFARCEALEELDLSNFNTDKVQSMMSMFYRMLSIKELDLSSFNTSNVGNMRYLFEYDKNLKTIYVTDAFSTEKAQDAHREMFDGCVNLVGAIPYDANVTDKTHANYTTGYFTKGCTHKDASGQPTLMESKKHAANCCEPASTEYTCSLCHRTKTVYEGKYQPGAHEVKLVEASEPTCETDGRLKHYVCEVCGRLSFSEDMKDAVTEAEVTVAKLGHKLDTKGDCATCGAHIMQLHGVTAELVNATDVDWNVFNDADNGCYGFEALKKGDLGYYAIIFTSNKTYQLKLKMSGKGEVVLLAGLYPASVTAGKELVLNMPAGKSKIIMRGSSEDAETALRVYDIIATTEKVPATYGKVKASEVSGTLELYGDVELDGVSENMAEFPEEESESPLKEYSHFRKVSFDKSYAGVKQKSLDRLFFGFNNLEEITGLENLNTSETETMSEMFYECRELTTLDLSSFNTAKVKNMDAMFEACNNLQTIYVGEGFTTAAVETSERMFADAERLIGAIEYDAEKDGAEYANYKTGYFTLKCDHKDAAGASLLTKLEDVAADCRTAAHSIYKCSRCLRNVEDNFTGGIDPTKHHFKKFTERKEPGCVAFGTVESYKCDICGNVYADDKGQTQLDMDKGEIAILPPGHDFDETYTCRKCHVQDTRYKALATNGVKVVIIDQDNPWKLVDENDATKGLQSSNQGLSNSNSDLALLLVSDKKFKLDADLKVESEYGNDVLSASLDGNEFARMSDIATNSLQRVLDPGAHFLILSYSKDVSTDVYSDMACMTGFSATTEYDAGQLKPYAAMVYNEDDNTMTLKAMTAEDTAGENETVYNIGLNQNSPVGSLPWTNVIQGVKSITIDKSFSQFRPKSTAGWFGFAVSATEINGLENLNTSEVEVFDYMFGFCASLKSLDLSHFDTGKAKSMVAMFLGLYSMEELDLTSFDTESLKSAEGMFHQSYGLERIYVSKKFNLASCDLSEGMFAYCPCLRGAKAYSDRNSNTADYANYFSGYLRTYYKVGDERFDLYGDSNKALTVDNLTLKEGKPFMTHDTFTAKKATLTRTLDGDDNYYHVGTVCLPYDICEDDNFSLYSVKEVVSIDGAAAKAAAAGEPSATVVLEKVNGVLPAGTPAIFKGKGNSVVIASKDVMVAENPVSDEQLEADGCMMRGAFTEYVVEDGYVHRGNQFVSSAMAAGEDGITREAPLTAYLQRVPGITADVMNMRSTDGEITAVEAIKALTSGKTQYFDLNGVKLNTFRRGVNILRTEDGKTIKVVVK